jgi:hypothetical protein
VQRLFALEVAAAAPVEADGDAERGAERSPAPAAGERPDKKAAGR